MGVDLVLMPALNKSCEAAHDMLSCERRRDLFDAIQEQCEYRLVPTHIGVMCYLGVTESGEDGYGAAFFDGYSEQLHIVTVGELLKLSPHDGVRDNFRNRGIWRLLGEYPADWPVVLFWT